MRTPTTLTRDQIVAAVTDLFGADCVITDPHTLREASVDRYRKYAAVHGIYDGPIPAAIVRPRSTEEVATILAFAQRERVAVVPRTGGTGTEGGLETVIEDSLVVDGSGMDRILAINEPDMMATVQCGVPLQVLEDAAREQGLTTGHSPQSKPLAQYGGLVATRSIGQFSTLYGGIEDMVVGLEAVLPGGETVRVKNVPRRAAGPDIRHVLIGNEGALAFITEVTVKLFRFHGEASARYFGYEVADFAEAVGVLREVMVDGYRPAVARVYSPDDARQHFPDHPEGMNLVVLSAEGPAPLVAATAGAIEAAAEKVAHTPVAEERIRTWFTGLNWGPEKIEAEKQQMLERPHLAYTTEVSVDWSRTAELYDAVMARMQEFDRYDDLTLLGAHSSHSYQTGTNLYFVYDYTVNCEPRDEVALYHLPLNAIVVEEALKVGGSIAHHHGIGKYRTPWVTQEHGSAWRLLEGLKRDLDPENVMNPGTIYPIG